MYAIRSACAAPVDAGGHTYSIYSLPKLTEAGIANIDRLPFVVRIMLENLLRHVGTEFATADDVTTFANWDPAKATPDIELAYMPARVVLQDFTGVPCVVDLAAMRSAVARLGGDVQQDQPARPRRPRHRPLGPGRSLRHVDGLRPERRSRIRAQPRALHAAPLGAGGVAELPRRPAGHRHRPPGQPRIPGQRGRVPRGRRRDGRLSRHAGRHRLAHDDDQRSRRSRLGRRRDRSRGRAARPAALPAHAGSRRRQALGRSWNRARPRPTSSSASPRCCAITAWSAGSSSSSGPGSRACRSPTAPRSPTCRPNTARRPASSRSTTRRCATCA